MAINNLERFIAASRNPMATAALFERDPDALPNLLQIFSTSQYLSDLLVVRQGSLRPVADDRRPTRLSPALVEELINEVALAAQLLRSARPRSAGSNAAKRCALLTAISFAINRSKPSCGRYRIWPTRSSKRRSTSPAGIWQEQYGHPLRADGERSRFCRAGLGKLGGNRTELFERHRPHLFVRARWPN